MAEAFCRDLVSKRRESGAAGITEINSAAWRDFQTINAALNEATVGQLMAVWEKHKHEVLGGDTSLPLGDAVAQHLDTKIKERMSAVAHRHLKLALERFVTFAGADTPLVSVDAAQIKAWSEDNAQRFGLGIIATRTNLKALKSFFSKAVIEEWITTSPADKVPLPKPPTWEVSVLSAENGEKLFASCANEPISLRIALEAFGGLRYSSSARLVKTDIRLEERGITLPGDKHKSGRRHYLEGLPDNLWTWIKRWWDNPRAWAMTERQILKAKSEAFTKAGVPHPKNVLRHSFCSHHIALNQDAAKTAVMLQHTSPTMLYKHYKGVSSKADAARWFDISP